MIRRVTVLGSGEGFVNVWRSLGLCANAPAPSSETGFILHGTIFAAEARGEGKIMVELVTHDPLDPRHRQVPNPTGPGLVQALIGDDAQE